MAVSAVVILILIGMVVVNYDWQPVRRALAIFQEIAESPKNVFLGPAGGPRREMWRTVMSKKVLSKENNTEKYKIDLLSIENGHVHKSEAIIDLNLNRAYYIRLSIIMSKNRLGVGILEAFSDKDHRKLIGRTGLVLKQKVLKNLFFFISDTGEGRGWTTISAILDNYRVEEPKDNMTFNFSKDEGLEWYEEWYKEKFGDSRGVIRSDQQNLSLNAYEQIVRAYVQKTSVLDEEDGWYTLEYKVTLNNLEPVQPLTGPARFYVGFHDGNSIDSSWQWEKLRNAVLIGHERILTPHEEGILQSERILKLSMELARENNSEKGAESDVNREARRKKMVREDMAEIKDLWDPTIAEDKHSLEQSEWERKLAKTYKAGSRVKDTKLIFTPESSESIWTPKSHLVHRGSTHNVYLDWYYYVGKIPFTLFVLFVFLLNITFFIFLFKQRKSSYFWFFLSTMLQLIVLSGLMYAHPGIWIKYTWFVFGIAGALMVLGSDSRISDKSD